MIWENGGYELEGMYSRLRLSVSRVRLVFSSVVRPAPIRILSSATIWLNYGQPIAPTVL